MQLDSDHVPLPNRYCSTLQIHRECVAINDPHLFNQDQKDNRRDSMSQNAQEVTLPIVDYSEPK